MVTKSAGKKASAGLRLDPVRESEALAKRCVEICEDCKAENILLFDVRKTSVLADFYLICNGTSDPHLRAIRVRLEKELAPAGVKLLHTSGTAASRWIILDFNTVLIHVFLPEMREFYKIEELWAKEPIIYRSRDAG